jgi:probable rRNA maturation factor
MNIVFSDDENRLTEEIRELMQSAGRAALVNEFGKDAAEADTEVSVTVVIGEEIRELNRDYRGIDRVTDVLSFPQYACREELAEILSDDEADTAFDMIIGCAGVVLLGDVVLCYDRAKEQAEEYGTGITREMVYLFVHSIFHLLGYDHEDEEEKRDMRAREEQALEAAGLGQQ